MRTEAEIEKEIETLRIQQSPSGDAYTNLVIEFKIDILEWVISDTKKGNNK